jgi:hypothetical protein
VLKSGFCFYGAATVSDRLPPSDTEDHRPAVFDDAPVME